MNCQIYAPAALYPGKGLVLCLLHWRLGEPQSPCRHVIYLLVVALSVKFTAFVEYLFYKYSISYVLAEK